MTSKADVKWCLRFYIQSDAPPFLFHVDVDRDEPVRVAMHRALRQAGYVSRFDAWDLRTAGGFLVADSKMVSELVSFDFNITRRAGPG